MRPLYRAATGVAASGTQGPGGPQILEQSELPLPQAANGELHLRLVQQIGQRRERAVLHFTAAEIQDDPGAVFRQDLLEEGARVVQPQLAAQQKLAAAFV